MDASNFLNSSNSSQSFVYSERVGLDSIFFDAALTPFCTVLLVSSVEFILTSGRASDLPCIAGSDVCISFVGGVVGAVGGVLEFGMLFVGGF